MIDLVSEGEIERESTRTKKELYELLKEYTNHTVLIRDEDIERVGVLQRLSFRRDTEEIFFSFDPSERALVQRGDHIAVKLDGVWKILNHGKSRNREL